MRWRTDASRCSPPGRCGRRRTESRAARALQGGQPVADGLETDLECQAEKVDVVAQFLGDLRNRAV